MDIQAALGIHQLGRVEENLRRREQIWQRYATDAEGAGHGGMDFFVVNAFVESVKRNVPPPIDVYDAASWSAISSLSERSIALGSEAVPFPDFTRGKWVKRRSSFGESDEF